MVPTIARPQPRCVVFATFSLLWIFRGFRPCETFPVLLFLWSFRKHQWKPRKHQGFSRSRKHPKRPRKSPAPREASTLTFKIRSCVVRSDLKNKHKISRKCLIFKIRSYSAGSDLKNKSARFSGQGKHQGNKNTKEKKDRVLHLTTLGQVPHPAPPLTPNEEVKQGPDLFGNLSGGEGANAMTKDTLNIILGQNFPSEGKLGEFPLWGKNFLSEG